MFVLFLLLLLFLNHWENIGNVLKDKHEKTSYDIIWGLSYVLRNDFEGMKDHVYVNSTVKFWGGNVQDK